MKKMLFAAFAAVATLAMVGCDKKDNGGQQGGIITVEAQPEVQPTANAFTVVVRFNEVPCNDVYFIGSYLNAAGSESSWGKDDAAVLMKPVGNLKTWFSCVIYPKEDGTATGKPVQLQEDGSFDWSGQPALNSLQLIAGNCEMQEENGGEIKFNFYTEAAAKAALDADPDTKAVATSGVVYAEATGWKVSPCIKKEHYAKVTFNLEIKGDAQEAVYLHGPFVDESWNGLEMKKIDGNHFTIEVENLDQYTEYQYTLAPDNWDAKGIFEEDGEAGSGNQKVSGAEVNDIVYGFAG